MRIDDFFKADFETPFIHCVDEQLIANIKKAYKESVIKKGNRNEIMTIGNRRLCYLFICSLCAVKCFHLF